MQFTEKIGTALFVVIVSGACLIGFGTGLLVGRQFPAHHFEKIPSTPYILDTSTGHVCAVFVEPSTNPYSKYFGQSEKDSNGVSLCK